VKTDDELIWPNILNRFAYSSEEIPIPVSLTLPIKYLDSGS
jgi:hypothetical protein